jgi:hypothetical protein
VHDPEICSLDRVVGVEGVRDPILVVIVCTSGYLDFISYAVMLTSLRTIGLDQRRMSSCMASWVWDGVPLDVGSVGCIVGGIMLTVKIRQPSHEFTTGVGISFIPYPLVLTPVV